MIAKFCRVCGAPMAAIKAVVAEYFDPQTGSPVTETEPRWDCSSQASINRAVASGGHSSPDAAAIDPKTGLPIDPGGATA